MLSLIRMYPIEQTHKKSLLYRVFLCIIVKAGMVEAKMSNKMFMIKEVVILSHNQYVKAVNIKGITYQ